MGIGGSGISAVALYAKKSGYQVSGCDLNLQTAYTTSLIKNKVKIFQGHSVKHLKGADLLVVTPSVLFQNSEHPEIVSARREHILLTWEKFLGSYLQKDKMVICISGTHGKSTTSAMTGLLLEKAGFDPNVILGAVTKEWDSNLRVGKSKYFVTEADEFYDNFLNYHPEIIIINNIEFDHPDYFASYDEVLDSFTRFVKNIQGGKIIIVNQDSKGVQKVMKNLGRKYLKSIKLVGYTLKKKVQMNIEDSFYGKIISKDTNSTIFSVFNSKRKLKEEFSLTIPGSYNVANSLGVIALGNILGIKTQTIRQSLADFNGIKRRLEYLGENKGIKVYDDYAHHPTAIKATLSALRQLYPNNKITVVDEPHSFSRTKAILSYYKGVFNDADKLIVGPVFKARDNQNYGVSGQSIVDVSDHSQSIYLDSFDKIKSLLIQESKKDDIIIFMGAGNSYKWSRDFLKSLKYER